MSKRWYVACPSCGQRMRNDSPLCAKCSARRNGAMSRRAEPLASRIARCSTIAPSGCWEWSRYRNPYGYGLTGVGKGKYLAHRVSYSTFVGPIPAGLTLDHLCRNRACVNPDHLEPVTMRENTLRGVSPAALRAQQTHCLRGHPYEGRNIIRQEKGWRTCRTCKQERERARYWKSKPALRIGIA
jgi:hypothetical protein